MRDDPTDIARRSNAAFNAGDLETMAKYYAQDVVWEDLRPAPGQEPVIRGLENVVATFRLYLDSFDSFEARILDGENVGDAAIGTVEWRGVGIESGVPFVQRSVDVFWVQDGQITRYVSGFDSKDDGLRAISDHLRLTG